MEGGGKGVGVWMLPSLEARAIARGRKYGAGNRGGRCKGKSCSDKTRGDSSSIGSGDTKHGMQGGAGGGGSYAR